MSRSIEPARPGLRALLAWAQATRRDGAAWPVGYTTAMGHFVIGVAVHRGPISNKPAGHAMFLIEAAERGGYTVRNGEPGRYSDIWAEVDTPEAAYMAGKLLAKD